MKSTGSTPLVLNYCRVGLNHCLMAEAHPARRHLFQLVRNQTPRFVKQLQNSKYIARYHLRDDVRYWLFQQGINPWHCIQYIYAEPRDSNSPGPHFGRPESIVFGFPSKSLALQFKLTFG